MSATTTTADAARPERMLTFASGGWVLVLTGIASVALLVWAIAPAVFRYSKRPPGDGHDPASYLFALEPTAGAELSTLVAAHVHRDLLQPLDDPATMAGGAVLRYTDGARGKYLVPTDRVIGVRVNGAARAYPLMVLNNHEVVNDVLGDVPIVVSYSPLCDSAMVFDRRGSDGVERRFGVSGLLLDSNLVMYDRRFDAQGQPTTGGEWLWSQLEGASITGDVADAPPVALRQLPASLVTWGAWFERHPETTVVAPDNAMIKRYRETSYASYFMSDKVAYPLRRDLPEDDLDHAKERWIVIEADEERRAFAFIDIAQRAMAEETTSVTPTRDPRDPEARRAAYTWRDGDLVFSVEEAGAGALTVDVERANGERVVATCGLRFALYSFRWLDSSQGP